MCSIVGLQGNFKGNEIIKLLKYSKSRGPDSTGLFLDNKVYLDIDLDNYSNENFYKIGLGHNLLNIFNLGDNQKKYQPMTNGKLTLIFNGEIYNFSLLIKYLKKDNITSDGQLILELINYFYEKNSNLLDSFKKTLNLLDGDFSIAIYDGKNLAIARDPLGVKPLFYCKSGEVNVFSSSKYSLKQCGFENIESLPPGEILYNWIPTPFREKIHEKRFKINGDIKSQLKTKLKLATLKRVDHLNEIAVILSGGVDSSLLTLILNEISRKKDLEIKLYSVGVKNSKDIEASKKIANNLNLPLKIQEVTPEIVKSNLKEVVNLIGENNLMKIGVGMTIYLATKIIHEDGIKVAISGQGADELFGGYNRYLNSDNLDEELRFDISNMYHVNLERDDSVSMANSVELRLPFLDKDLVEFALNIPFEYKISSFDDNIRKNILRDVAYESGLLDEIAYRPKKAAQYGTGIDKILRKKVLKEVDIDKILENYQR